MTIELDLRGYSAIKDLEKHQYLVAVHGPDGGCLDLFTAINKRDGYHLYVRVQKTRLVLETVGWFFRPIRVSLYHSGCPYFITNDLQVKSILMTAVQDCSVEPSVRSRIQLPPRGKLEWFPLPTVVFQGVLRATFYGVEGDLIVQEWTIGDPCPRATRGDAASETVVKVTRVAKDHVVIRVHFFSALRLGWLRLCHLSVAPLVKT